MTVVPFPRRPALVLISNRQTVNARLLEAAKSALWALDCLSLDDLMEGKDSMVRAELLAAIREAEDQN